MRRACERTRLALRGLAICTPAPPDLPRIYGSPLTTLPVGAPDCAGPRAADQSAAE